MSLVFEWDPRKARSNLKKHRVTFAEAVSAFSSPLARIFPDEEHSAEKSREIVIGHSAACGETAAADLLRRAGDGSGSNYQCSTSNEERTARL
jgi:uncharacterized DUF497 family protein